MQKGTSYRPAIYYEGSETRCAQTQCMMGNEENCV